MKRRHDYQLIVVMSPASKDVDAFHPISDKRERSTAYLRAIHIGNMHAIARMRTLPSVIDVPVLNKLDELVSSMKITRRYEAHGYDNHARQRQHIHFEASPDIVDFTVNPQMEHGIKRVHNIIDKNIVAPSAAVAVDAAPGGGRKSKTMETCRGCCRGK
jgi:hypothetical protein